MSGIGRTFAQRANAVLEAPSDRLDHMVIAAGLDPAADLRYGNWRGFDLSEADLRGFNFTGADLSGARFDNALITGGRSDSVLRATAFVITGHRFESCSRHRYLAEIFRFSILKKLPCPHCVRKAAAVGAITDRCGAVLRSERARSNLARFRRKRPRPDGLGRGAA